MSNQGDLTKRVNKAYESSQAIFARKLVSNKFDKVTTNSNGDLVVGLAKDLASVRDKWSTLKLKTMSKQDWKSNLKQMCGLQGASYKVSQLRNRNYEVLVCPTVLTKKDKQNNLFSENLSEHDCPFFIPLQKVGDLWQIRRIKDSDNELCNLCMPFHSPDCGAKKAVASTVMLAKAIKASVDTNRRATINDMKTTVGSSEASVTTVKARSLYRAREKVIIDGEVGFEKEFTKMPTFVEMFNDQNKKTIEGEYTKSYSWYETSADDESMNLIGVLLSPGVTLLSKCGLGIFSVDACFSRYPLPEKFKGSLYFLGGKEAGNNHNIPVAMMVRSEKGESQAGWREFGIQCSKNKELLNSMNSGFTFSDRSNSKSYICDQTSFFY